jgi:hypothetical protein
MGERSPWMWTSLGLICLLIVVSYIAVYYHNESAHYRSLYERAAADLKKLTMPVNILIDYGNGTRKWYNNTLVPREANLLLATEIIASVKSITYPEMGKFVTNINGVGGDPGKYWIWYIWNRNESRWDWGPVACDKYILREGDTVMWRYEQF